MWKLRLIYKQILLASFFVYDRHQHEVRGGLQPPQCKICVSEMLSCLIISILSPKEPISHLLVQNGIILIILQNKTILQIRIQTAEEKILSTQCSPPPDKIKNVFLDYRGMHGVVSTMMGENFYLNTKSAALKNLRRLKVSVLYNEYATV